MKINVRLDSSCIPHPEAILVNKIKMKTLLSTNLSHYQMMLNIQKNFFNGHQQYS